MMVQNDQYDVVFTGTLVEGISSAQAQENLARLFKTSPENVQRFFTGKPQLLKRSLNKAEALKYKAVLHQAGLLVAFRPSTQTSSNEPANTAQTAATTSEQASPAPTSHQAGDSAITLAPPGTEVLKPEERRNIPQRDIDTSAIKLASVFAPVEATPEATAAVPDTRHLSVAPAGEVLSQARPVAAPVIELDHLDLCPAGTALDELHAEHPELHLDLSQFSVAEPGADLLGEKKAPPAAPVPNTDHLSVQGD